MCTEWADEQDAIGDLLDDRDGDHDGFDAHWDARIAADETGVHPLLARL